MGDGRSVPFIVSCVKPITIFCPHAASSLCFAEKTIYTQEVLAVVLQQLMEMNPLPTLFMRTVIISLPVSSDQYTYLHIHLIKKRLLWKFATVETRRELGRASFRKDFWDR